MKRADLVIFAVAFGLALGLGYSSFGRFDPQRTVGLSDARWYVAMAEGRVDEVPAPWRFRVLVPTLASATQRALPGSLGTSHGGRLGFLLVEAFFVACTAMLIARWGRIVAPDGAVAVTAPLLFLASWTVPSQHLAGLTDAAECAALTLAALCVAHGRALFAALAVVLAIAARETALPLATAGLLAVVWVRHRAGLSPRTALTACAATATLGLVTWWTIRALVGDHPAGPRAWPSFDLADLGTNLVACLGARSNLYAFGVLAPLAWFGRRAVSTELAAFAGGAAVAALLLAAWAGIGENVSRPLFSALGPMLSLAASVGLSRLTA